MKRIQDPGITLIGLLSITIVSFSLTNTIQLHLLMGLSLLYLLSLLYPAAALRSAAFYIVFWLLVYWLPSSFGSFTVILFMTVKILPMLTIAAALLTVPPNVLMWRGALLGLPQKAVLTLGVLLRFFAMIRLEMQAVFQGIRARGMLPHWYSVLLHPAQSYECLVLPLIIRGLRLSTELTCAAEFRGVESGIKRTCIYTAERKRIGVARTICLAAGCVVIFMLGEIKWLN
jgi:energy-coupling factor transport system permease protein